MAYSRKGLHDKAVKSLTRCLDIDPDNSKAYFHLGVGYIGQSQVEDAIASLERAIAIQPLDWKSYYQLGIAYDHKGYSERARAAYRKAESLRG